MNAVTLTATEDHARAYVLRNSPASLDALPELTRPALADEPFSVSAYRRALQLLAARPHARRVTVALATRYTPSDYLTVIRPPRPSRRSTPAAERLPRTVYGGGAPGAAEPSAFTYIGPDPA